MLVAFVSWTAQSVRNIIGLHQATETQTRLMERRNGAGPSQKTHIMDESTHPSDERAATLAALDAVIKDLKQRMRIALHVRKMVEEGRDVPDVTRLINLPHPTDLSQRPWALRPGSDAERVVKILENAGESGASEGEILEELHRQGRLLSVKDPARSLHWTLYNLRRRSNALQRDATGCWKLIAPIARKS